MLGYILNGILLAKYTYDILHFMKANIHVTVNLSIEQPKKKPDAEIVFTSSDLKK
jgi:hypothetical protein